MTRERRRHIRVPGPIAARIVAWRERIEILDLSEGGCFVNWMGDSPKPGESLSIVLEQEGDGGVTVNAEIVYAHGGKGFGVLFTGVPDETYRKLEALVAKLRERGRG